MPFTHKGAGITQQSTGFLTTMSENGRKFSCWEKIRDTFPMNVDNWFTNHETSEILSVFYKLPFLVYFSNSHRLWKGYRCHCPRAFFCCRQKTKLRIVRGIRLYDSLSWPVFYNQTDAFFHGCRVVACGWVTVNFNSHYRILMRWN